VTISNHALVLFLVSVLAGILGTVKTQAAVELRPVVAGLLSLCWVLLVVEGLRVFARYHDVALYCSVGYGFGACFAVLAKRWR
jgi:hypothetical protein